MSMTLPPDLQRHLDHQSKRYAISKAGYLRMLLAKDLEAQAQLRTAEG